MTSVIKTGHIPRTSGVGREGSHGSPNHEGSFLWIDPTESMSHNVCPSNCVFLMHYMPNEGDMDDAEIQRCSRRNDAKRMRIRQYEDEAEARKADRESRESVTHRNTMVIRRAASLSEQKICSA